MITPSRLGSLQVEVTVELDARLHGWEIAQNESSIEQARLLAGLAVGFEDLGTLHGSMQIAYLAGQVRKLPEDDRRRIELMLDELREGLRTSSGNHPGGES